MISARAGKVLTWVLSRALLGMLAAILAGAAVGGAAAVQDSGTQLQGEFWPDNFGEWSLALGSVLGMVTSALLFVWRVGRVAGQLQQKHDDDMDRMRTMIQEGVDKLDARIRDVEAGCRENSSLSHTNEARINAQQYEIAGYLREISELRGEGNSLVSNYEKHVAEAYEVEASLRERVARLEERTGVPHRKGD